MNIKKHLVENSKKLEEYSIFDGFGLIFLAIMVILTLLAIGYALADMFIG